MASTRRHWLHVATAWGLAAGHRRLAAGDMPLPLRVGFITPYPPFSAIDPNSGDLDGFDVQIVKAWAQHERHTLQVRSGQAPEVLAWLAQGHIDFIGNQLLATPDLRERFIFAAGYVDLRLILCQREDDERDFLSLEDFLGHRLGVLSGTAADVQGTAVLGQDVTRFNSTQAGLAALLAGDIDAFIDESLILDHLIFKQRLAVKTTTPFSPPIRTGWAVAPKNRALRERLNQGVAWLKSSGALRGISEAWFGYDVSQKRAGAWVGSPNKP